MSWRRRRRGTQWLNQTKKNPHSAAHYGVYAFKPKSPLAIVDTGIDPYMGVAVWLEAHKQNEFKYRPAQDRTAVQRFGEMTAPRSLQVLVPLFIVLMTFSAFAGEREQGTLAAGPESRRQPRDLASARRRHCRHARPGAAAGDHPRRRRARADVGWRHLTSDPSRRRSSCGLSHLLRDLHRRVARRLGAGAFVATRAGHAADLLVREQSRRLACVRRPRRWLHPTPSAVEFQKAMEADLNNPAGNAGSGSSGARPSCCANMTSTSVDALPIAFSGHLAAGRRESRQRGVRPSLRAAVRHLSAPEPGLPDRRAWSHRRWRCGRSRWAWPAPTSSSIAISSAPRGLSPRIQRTMNDDITAHQQKGQCLPRRARAVGAGAGFRLRGAIDRMGARQHPVESSGFWRWVARCWPRADLDGDGRSRPWPEAGSSCMSARILSTNGARCAPTPPSGWSAVSSAWPSATRVLNGVRWVGFQRAALEAAAAEEADRYERCKRRSRAAAESGVPVSPFADPRNPTKFGGRLGPRYATLPPAPLAPLAIGQSDLLPYYFKVSTDARETSSRRPRSRIRIACSSGRFDLAFVLVFLYPLLILAVTYNMLSAEKEQGTLALALSQPISLGTLVTGKVMLRALLARRHRRRLLAARAPGDGREPDGSPARRRAWPVASGCRRIRRLLVRARGAGRVARPHRPRRTRRSWPRVAGAGRAAALALQPHRHDALSCAFAGRDGPGHARRLRRGASAASTLLARYYEDHPELASGGAEQAMNDFNIVRVAVDDDVARRVRPVVDRYEQQIARQQATIDRLRFLSPAVLMQDALNDVAGTGMPRHRPSSPGDRYHARWRGLHAADLPEGHHHRHRRHAPIRLRRGTPRRGSRPRAACHRWPRAARGSDWMARPGPAAPVSGGLTTSRRRLEALHNVGMEARSLTPGLKGSLGIG